MSGVSAMYVRVIDGVELTVVHNHIN